jgi:hypothetical protein
MQTKLLEQLSAADAAIILERLPERIRAAMIDSAKPRLRQRAAEIEYPIEAINPAYLETCSFKIRVNNEPQTLASRIS